MEKNNNVPLPPRSSELSPPKSVLCEAQDIADGKLAELAKDGDMDAMKLLGERMQERKELELRLKLFGV